jgi:hypothetical protein
MNDFIIAAHAIVYRENSYLKEIRLYNTNFRFTKYVLTLFFLAFSNIFNSNNDKKII